MKKITLALLCIAALVGGVLATELYEYKRVPGTDKMTKKKVVEKRKDAKTRNGFGAQFFLTTDQTIFKRWEQPSKGFSIQRMSKVERGKFFFPLVIFNNPKRDSSGNVRVSYILRVIKPDGKLYFEEFVQAWNGRPRHSGMEMNRNYITVSMEDTDSFGTYTVKAFVRDEVGMTDLELETQFDLINKLEASFKEGGQLTDDELNEVLTYFYRDKKIEMIPAVIKKLSNTPGFLDRSSNLKYFFSEVFRLHPDQISEGINGVSTNNKMSFYQFLLDSVWLSDTLESKAFLKQAIENKNNKKHDYVKALLSKKPHKLIDKKIASPSDLDALWGAYFGSGNVKYVQKIALQITAPRVKSRNAKMIQYSAKWSLLSNCKQHKEVSAFVMSEFKRSSAPATYRKELGEILKELKSEK